MNFQPGASEANPSLDAGLAALKREDYSTAIAHLEGICEVELHEPSIWRAMMGLVVAYDRTGQTQQAIALCETLNQTDNDQVKQWANRTLASLVQRYPPSSPPTTPGAPDSNPTGFVPIEKAEAATHKAEAATHKAEAATHKAEAATHKAEGGRHKAEAATHKAEINKPLYSEYQPSWRNAGRAKKTRPLKTVKKWRLFSLQLGTAIALFVVMRAVFQCLLATTNDILLRLPLLEPIQEFYSFYYAPNPPILITLGVLLVACPWLLDGLLQLFYGQQPLSIEQLATHSPEAAKTIKNFCLKKNLPRPTLKLLPTDAPVALTYGNVPHTARIAVSQGLLDRLEDQEIATIYAGELGHIVNWDFALMSLAVLVVQIPYTIYWQVAQLASIWPNVQTLPGKCLRGAAAAISALAYGIYWLLRSPVLWLSRMRLLYSDRLAVELTSNPNALSRALLKIAIGISSDILKQQQTSYLLESFEMLMPVGHQQALTIGSLHGVTPLSPLLECELRNPYRQWLAIDNSHPPISERLHVLAQIARFWNIETEIDLGSTKSSAVGTQRPKLKMLLLQAAPFFGVLIGLAIGSFLWVVGWLSVQMHVRAMTWILRDSQWMLNGLLLIGFSLGTLVRVNRFFPDIKLSKEPAEPRLPTLLAKEAALPIDSQPIRLEGKLLGRSGIGNWLGQDLLLQTATGLVKLHYVSTLGPIGNLWPQSTRPCDLVNRQIVATGWLRCGATPWIDIEILSTTGRLTSYSGHPMWSTILAFALALWGIYLISVGGL